VDNFKRTFEQLPANGWLTEEEAWLLWQSAARTTGPILEVGCYYGRSTVLLAALGRTVYSVDSFDNFDTDDPDGNVIHQAFLDNINSRGITNVVLFRERIEDWEMRQVGFAYLDGDHSYQGTINQIDVALKCGADLICLHDYCNDGGGREVVRAVEDRGLSVTKTNHVGRMVSCLMG
jgi:SAM-dependent methyltransferase